MLTKEMIELVQQHHPKMGEVEIIKLINRAKDDFCARTEIVKDTYTVATTADKRYYNLDKRIIKIQSIWLNDVLIPKIIGKPIIDDDELSSTNPLGTPGTISNERYYYESVGRIGIVEKITNSTNNITRDDN